MTKFEEAKNNTHNNVIVFNGKQYVVLCGEEHLDTWWQQGFSPFYIDVMERKCQSFTGSAICEDDGDDGDLHDVRWQIKPEYIDELPEDLSEACDWDKPAQIDSEWADWLE